jgi:UDP-N-acetylglucosamine--N-acetylmuramyl-(pentapeptide) pyrophosphoryl-undecaprenol N-acetylglucosamine transferase
MVLIPLPTAAADHQTSNARALERAGAALVIKQRALTRESLEGAIRSLGDDRARLASLAAGAVARGRPDAAETIARRILTLLDVKQIRS